MNGAVEGLSSLQLFGNPLAARWVEPLIAKQKRKNVPYSFRLAVSRVVGFARFDFGAGISSAANTRTVCEYKDGMFRQTEFRSFP